MNGPIPDGHDPNDAGHVVGNQLKRKWQKYFKYFTAKWSHE